MRQTFGGRMDHPEHAIAGFRAQIAEGQRMLAPGRLLTFSVAEGWLPLCRFLAVPAPETAFPHANRTEAFRTRQAARAQAKGAP